jgi:cytochrome P450
MTTLTDSSVGIPDFTDPATYVPGVPHAVFDELRSRPDLYWQPAAEGTLNGGFWVVTRYQEVTEIEQQPALFSSVPGAFYPLANMAGDGPMSKHILFMDPPDHSRVRRVAMKSFGPRVVAKFHDWILDIVVETLDDAVALGEFDWIEQVARLIPSRVIAAVMGIPVELRGQVVQWSDAIFEGQVSQDDDGAAMARAFQEVNEYMAALGQEKLRNPQDDMATVIAQSLDRGEIDEGEYAMYTTALLIAGYETTHTLVGQSVRLMLEDADIAGSCETAIAAGGSGEVIDEFLRYVTPAMNVTRTATEDLEFHGQAIRRGDTMQLMLNAANRDPGVFTDPHRFNPGRARGQALSFGGDGLAFGSGLHRCVGNVLAKMDAQLLVEEMHRRRLRLELSGEPRRGWSTLINQLLSLPVRVVSR